MRPRRIVVPAKLPVGLIGALGLIIGVECFMVADKADTMDASLWVYEQDRQVASGRARDCGFLAFGDSLVRHGVSAQVIRERTGLEGYNLALAGSQIPAGYIFFREALASGARPKAVLLDLFPCLLADDPWPNITNWPVIASYGDCLAMGWGTRDSRLLASLLLRKAIPSVRCRESTRVAIREALDGLGGISRTNIQIALRNLEVNLGMAIAGNRYDPKEPLEHTVGRLFQPIRCTPLNRYYIDQFMNLAAAHDVTVFLLLPPHMAHLQARLEQVGFDADHDRFVRSMLERHPGLKVLDARRSNYANDAFIDTHHLGYEGATILSAEVGDAIARELDNPGSATRWSSLPAYRRRTITAPHESLDETRVAFLRDLEARRRR